MLKYASDPMLGEEGPIASSLVGAMERRRTEVDLAKSM